MENIYLIESCSEYEYYQVSSIFLISYYDVPKFDEQFCEKQIWQRMCSCCLTNTSLSLECTKMAEKNPPSR